MIVNELISNIQAYFNNGVKSDDYILSDRLIYKDDIYETIQKMTEELYNLNLLKWISKFKKDEFLNLENNI